MISTNTWESLIGQPESNLLRGLQKRCRLSWLTNSALVYEPKKYRGRRSVTGSQPMSTAVHRSPNKLWGSNSIFNIYESPVGMSNCTAQNRPLLLLVQTRGPYGHKTEKNMPNTSRPVKKKLADRGCHRCSDNTNLYLDSFFIWLK